MQVLISFSRTLFPYVARNLNTKIPGPSRNLANAIENKKVAGNEEMQEISEELATIDYTPARRKTPIHNQSFSFLNLQIIIYICL